MKSLLLVLVSLFLVSCSQEESATPTAESPTGGKDDSFEIGAASETCPDPSTLTRPEYRSCRGENGQFVNTECCYIECTNVWVNYDLNSDLFEEGFGSAFDYDPDGYPMTDGDSTQTTMSLVPFREGRAQMELSMGQFGIDTDEAEIETFVGEGGDSNYRGYRATTEEGEEFEFRVFDEPKIGILMYKAKGEDNFRHYGTSDCRDGNAPPYY